MTTTDFGTCCPSCGRLNDAHTGVSGKAAPEPGDVSLCFGCAEPAIYTQDLQLRRPTDDERAEIIASPLVEQARGILLLIGLDKEMS